jgi:hypothetical protein
VSESADDEFLASVLSQYSVKELAERVAKLSCEKQEVAHHDQVVTFKCSDRPLLPLSRRCPRCCAVWELKRRGAW